MSSIVILHGWGRGRESFLKLKEILENKGIKVYLFDMPGFGKEPDPPFAWSVSDYADFVLDYIKKNNINNYYLFGHSFGGRVAIKIAALNSENIAGLILCDSAGVTLRLEKKLNFFSKITKLGKSFFGIWPFKCFYNPVRFAFYFLIGKKDYYRAKTEVMRGTFKKVVAENLTHYLSSIKNKTFIIWGEKDKMTPLEDAYIIKEGIKGSELKIFEGVGHNPHLEKPEDLARVIEDFIKDNS